MAHRLTEAHKKNKQLCRLNRDPVLAAEIAAISATSRTNVLISLARTPYLTIAMGDLATDGPVTPLGSPAIRASLAKAMAIYVGNRIPSINGMQMHQRAIMFTEMTMSCVGGCARTTDTMQNVQTRLLARLRGTVPPEMSCVGDCAPTIAAMRNARTRLLTCLRDTVPPENEVQSVFTRLWDMISGLGGNNSYPTNNIEGLSLVPGILAGNQVDQRKYHAYSKGGHVFHPEFVQPARASALWGLLLNIRTAEDWARHVNIDLTDAERGELRIDYNAFANAYSTASLHHICAYYEAYAAVNSAECENHSVHALFTCLAQLAKGQNKTTSWVTSKFRRVQESIAGLGDLDPAIVQEFSKLNESAKMTGEQIFAATAATYKCLSDTPAASSSLCWIIENWVASNIAGVITIADIISKTQYFPLTMLIGEVIPETEFQAMARIAMHVFINKFGTLAGLTVAIKEYADLAYLALAIHKKGGHANALPNSLYDYQQFLKLSKTDLDTIASEVHSMSNSSNRVSLMAMIKKHLGDNAAVMNHNGETSIFIDLGPRTNVAEEGINTPPAGAVPMAHLPTDLRNTNHYYKKTEIETFLTQLREQETEKTKAFRSIMSDLCSCGIKSSAHFADMMNTKYQLPYSALTDIQRRNLSLWLDTEVRDYETAHPASQSQRRHPHYYLYVPPAHGE